MGIFNLTIYVMEVVETTLAWQEKNSRGAMAERYFGILDLPRPAGVPNELKVKKLQYKHKVERIHSMLSLDATASAEKLFPEGEKERERKRQSDAAERDAKIQCQHE